jgi:hypothetical protein
MRWHTTMTHPKGWSGVPWFEVRGSKVYPTTHHPDGWSGLPWFQVI